MRPPELLAASAELDGEIVPELAVGEGLGVAKVLEAGVRLRGAGARVLVLEIAPLSDPWEAPPPSGRRRFKSGCGPVLGLKRARDALAGGEADAVILRGEDLLKTGYPRAERRRLMDIWPDLGVEGLPSIPEAYTRLAEAWMARHGIDAARFRRLADGLLDGYAATSRGRGGEVDLSALRAVRVTRLFRLGDCANPDVDFRGAALLARSGWDGGSGWAAAVEAVLRSGDEGAAGSGASRRVLLAGVETEAIPDGPEHIPALATYAHLDRAARRAFSQAGEPDPWDLAVRWRSGEVLLETYTCFPVVPLAFLLASGLVRSPDALEETVASTSLTVTGGMNLARAPWNNPVLHALAVMWARLRAGGSADVGVLHGNGGLGGWQGVAVLRSGE